MVQKNDSKIGLRELRIWRPLHPGNRWESVFEVNPSLTFRTVWTILTRKHQLSLTHFRGVPAEIDALMKQYVEGPPESIENIQVLRHAPGDLLALEKERSGVDPTDISVIVRATLGADNLFQVSADHAGLEWRILTTRIDKVQDFLDHLVSQGRRLGLTYAKGHTWFRLESVRPHGTGPFFALDSLDTAERAALRAATDLGYFDDPRRAGITQIAQRLGLPRSTAHRQLRRAQRKLVVLGLQTTG